MGPTGPSARTAPYFFFFFAAFFFFAIVSPPPAPARPAVMSTFPRLYGHDPRSVKRKIHHAGVASTAERNILGPKDPEARRRRASSARAPRRACGARDGGRIPG